MTLMTTVAEVQSAPCKSYLEVCRLAVRLEGAGFNWATRGTGHSTLILVPVSQAVEARKFLADAGSGI